MQKKKTGFSHLNCYDCFAPDRTCAKHKHNEGNDEKSKEVLNPPMGGHWE